MIVNIVTVALSNPASVIVFPNSVLVQQLSGRRRHNVEGKVPRACCLDWTGDPSLA